MVRPVTVRPVTAQPVTAQPVTAQPVTAQPVTARENYGPEDKAGRRRCCKRAPFETEADMRTHRVLHARGLQGFTRGPSPSRSFPPCPSPTPVFSSGPLSVAWGVSRLLCQ